jgi:hypothetical protein
MCGGWTSEIFEKKDRGYVRPVLFGVRFIGFIFIEASHSVTLYGNVRTFVLKMLEDISPHLLII